jgi:voltage-gated potassium channel
MLAKDDDGHCLLPVLSVINWIFWGIFVAEFFRALRALRILRVTRFGRVLSAGVRDTRSAEKLLSNRVAWLIAVTAIIILGASQLLYILAAYASYLDALYEAALATITGAGFTADTVFARILHVVLAIFSVVVFATLASTLGAYFLGRETTQETPSAGPDPTTHLANNLRQEDKG